MALIFLGILLLVIFIAPMIVMSVVNIGNIGGALLGAAFIVLGRYWRALPDRWQHIILGVLGAAAVLIVIETVCMVRAAGKAPAEDAVVIVLGCKVKPYGPSLSLQERIEAAAE